MPLRLFAFAPPPTTSIRLCVSVYSWLGISHSRWLCWRVPLIPLRCSWALRLQGKCRLVQSQLRMKLIYPEKKKKTHPTHNQWHHEESVPHWWEKLLNLAAIFYQGFFFFWGSQLRRVTWCGGLSGCEPPPPPTPCTFSLMQCRKIESSAYSERCCKTLALVIGVPPTNHHSNHFGGCFDYRPSLQYT